MSCRLRTLTENIAQVRGTLTVDTHSLRVHFLNNITNLRFIVGTFVMSPSPYYRREGLLKRVPDFDPTYAVAVRKKSDISTKSYIV